MSNHKSQSGKFSFYPQLNPETTTANLSTYKALCVWRISNGNVRLFNLFTVR